MNALRRISLARRLVRDLKSNLRQRLNCPDAYADIARLVMQSEIAHFLDIGAFDGDMVERWLDSTPCHVHAFEPFPSSAKQLAQRFEKNPRVSIYPVAVSDRVGTANLNVNANKQTNSLHQNDVGNRKGFPHETRHLETIKVPTTTLSHWNDEHASAVKCGVKADVQGAELQVINGSIDFLKKSVAFFYSEAQLAPMYVGGASFFDIHNALTHQCKFYLYNIYPCMVDKDGRALQTDAMWLNSRFFPDCFDT